MLLGVAVAAAKMLGVLPGVAEPPVVGVPTVLTDRLPGGAFLTGTTTLLSGGERDARVDQSARRRWIACLARWGSDVIKSKCLLKTIQFYFVDKILCI